jgi:hypothetical protein
MAIMTIFFSAGIVNMAPKQKKPAVGIYKEFFLIGRIDSSQKENQESVIKNDVCTGKDHIEEKSFSPGSFGYLGSRENICQQECRLYR